MLDMSQLSYYISVVAIELQLKFSLVSVVVNNAPLLRNKERTMSCNVIERFSIECRKTKTKVITLANNSRRKQRNEPTRIQSKYM